MLKAADAPNNSLHNAHSTMWYLRGSPKHASSEVKLGLLNISFVMFSIRPPLQFPYTEMSIHGLDCFHRKVMRFVLNKYTTTIRVIFLTYTVVLSSLIIRAKSSRLKYM